LTNIFVIFVGRLY